MSYEILDIDSEVSRLKQIVSQLQDQQDSTPDYTNSGLFLTSGKVADAFGETTGIKSDTPIVNNLTEDDESGTPTGTSNRIDFSSALSIIDFATPAVDMLLKFINFKPPVGTHVKLTPMTGRTLKIETGGDFDIASQITIAANEFLEFIFQSEDQTGITGGGFVPAQNMGTGGGITFPIDFPEEADRGTVTTTQTIDFSNSARHAVSMTIGAASVAIDFSNPPTNKLALSSIVVKQDGTGGRAISFVKTVINASTIIDAFAASAPGQGISFMVEWERGIWTAYLKSGNVVSGGVSNLSDLVIDANKDWAGFDITNLGGLTMSGDINFNTLDGINIDRLLYDQAAGSSIAAADTGTTSNATGDFIVNIPTGAQFEFDQNGSSLVTISSTEAGLAGAVNLFLNSNRLIFDIDQDTYMDANGDDLLEVIVGGFERTSWSLTEMLFEGGYNLNMNGNDVILDVDSDTYIHSNGDDEIQNVVGGTVRLTVFQTSVDLGTSVSLKLHDQLRFESGITTAPGNEYLIYRDSLTTDALVANLGTSAQFRIDRNNVEALALSVGELQLTHTTRMDVDLFRNDATPNDGDEIGAILFQGNNSTPSERFYAQLIGISKDVTAGTEDGGVLMRLMQGGVEVDMFQFRPNSNSSSTPVIEIYEDDQTPGNGSVGIIEFYGNNNAGTPVKTLFASILAQIDDVASGSEDGGLHLQVANGGSLNTLLELSGVGGADKIGAFGVTPVARPTITGSRGGNAALASLLTGLASLGWVIDSTT